MPCMVWCVRTNGEGVSTLAEETDGAMMNVSVGQAQYNNVLFFLEQPPTVVMVRAFTGG